MPKKKESTLTSWDEVNEAVKILGENQRKVDELESKLTVLIDRLKEKFEKKSAGLLREISELEQNIELFCDANKQEFIDDRTKKLTFGKISYRIVESLKVKNTAVTIKGLKQLKLTDCIKIKEEVNKEMLKGVEDAILLKIGVARVKKDKINIEPNAEEITRI